MTFKYFLDCIVYEYKRNIFWKSRLILLLFRISNFFALNGRVGLLFGAPFILLQIFVCEWLLGVEIHPKTRIGRGFVIYHGVGMVINGYSVIGDNFVVRQGCCIGNKILGDGALSGAPIIGNNVELGFNSGIIGDVRVGDRVVVGANSIVTKDCVADGIYAGCPATRIK
ncbi:hypothetical protein [Thalassolituus oleivorans]|uniref:hypothetical protein n=1 Tax=Thalassolituus oleivorans TaxID=187493 RepID=UPI0023F1F353|nr:hypothetical protein [Thalassolituus oleivorans]